MGQRFVLLEYDDPAKELRPWPAPLCLRRAEFTLLRYFLAHPNRVLSQRELIDNVFGGTHSGDSALVRVHVCHLRRALGRAGSAIVTLRGRGYLLDTKVAAGNILIPRARRGGRSPSPKAAAVDVLTTLVRRG